MAEHSGSFDGPVETISSHDGRTSGKGRGYAENIDADDWGNAKPASSSNNGDLASKQDGNRYDDGGQGYTSRSDYGNDNDRRGGRGGRGSRGGRRDDRNDHQNSYRRRNNDNRGNNNDDWGNNQGSGERKNNQDDDWGNNQGSGGQKNNQDDDWGNNQGSGGRKNNQDDDWGNNQGSGGRKNNQDDDWGNNQGLGGRNNNQDNDEWGNNAGSESRGRGGGRGRRRRDNDDQGSGGRSGRRNRDNDNWGNDDRPSRRNDRDNLYDNSGKGDDRGNDENADGEEKKKEPVTYIPPEIDEDEFFGAGVTAGINFSKYEDIKVNVTGDNIPPPVSKFDDMSLRTALLDNIRKSGYTIPTPVQKYAIPIILQRRDVMACAQTGSGKTAAYLIPIIHHLLQNLQEVIITERGCEPQVIIMAPTRELVTQICNEGRKFAKGTMLHCIPCYGGVKPGYQADQLKRGAHIVVATPGRLNDFVQSGRVRFGSVRFMVLDEADRMLDQGFLSSMEQILDHESMIPAGERQTLMFSATFGYDIQQLATKFLRNYLFLAVGIVGGACTDVEQNFYEVTKSEKRPKLKQLLEEDESTLERKTLVFVETQKTADFLACYMSEQNFPSTSIHGAREQREREQALGDFRSGKRPILIATSVAARGLDIKNVSHVINYDLPKNIEDYVHRIGRTGRVGNRGKATSFFNPDNDSGLVPELVKILKQAAQPIPPCFDGSDGAGAHGQADDFGGYDIRDSFKPVEAEPEESW